jgi:hypothetical protein
MTFDDDRAQILRRRAAFVSSALAALGCSGAQPAPAAGGETPVVSVPPAPAKGEEPAAEQPPVAAEPAEQHPQPSYELPPGISDEARSRFEHLFTQVKSAHALLERMERTLPVRCDVTSSACDAQWRSIADGFVDYDELVRFLAPVCPGSSQGAKLYLERSRAHLDALAKRRGRLEQRIVDLMQTDVARARWDAHQGDARQARPMVCLSFACSDW